MKQFKIKLPWEKFFLFCLGISVSSFVIMHWIENDLVYQQKPFSILGLELWYSKEKIMNMFSGMDPEIRLLLRYHLRIDFIFMAGCFPGICCLCIIAASKVKKSSHRKFVITLGILQSAAWIFDIVENNYLLSWLDKPQIGNEFDTYHLFVYSKWVIASAGFWISIILLGIAKIRAKKES